MLNPVLRREAQTSLRNWKIFGAITLYIALVAASAGFFVWANVFNSYDFSFDPQSMIMLYALLSGLQLCLILVTVPALTAGSISGERERQTLDLLLVTKMSPFSIVFGKLMSCVGIVILMTIATVPVFAMIFCFGGISLLNLLAVTGFLIVTTCMVGAFSIFMSTVLKKTMISMVVVYLVIGFLCLGTLVGFLLYSSYTWSVNGSAPEIAMGYMFLSANPGIGFVSVIDSQIGTSVLAEMVGMYNSNFGFPVAFWVVNMIFDVAVMVVFLILAALNIRIGSKSRKK